MDKGTKQPWGDKERARVYERHLAKGFYSHGRSQEDIKKISEAKKVKWTGVY